MPVLPEAEWMQPCAELMAREGISLREAATRQRVALTNEQAATTFRTKIFQKLLRAERLRFALEVANDPAWSRRAAIGKMIYLVDELIAKGEFDKALEGLLKVGKMEGWLAADTNVNVFGSLTAGEVKAVRDKIAQRADSSGGSTAEQLPS